MEIYDAKQFIGCDVSKDKLDFAIHVPREEERLYPHIVVTNDKKGYNAFKKWLRANKLTLDECVVAMEHTGIYSEGLCDWLFQQSITFTMLNPSTLKSTGRIMRGKNDKLDSQRLAKYVYSNKDDLKPCTPPTNVIRDLRSLYAERENVMRSRVAAMNYCKTISKSSSSYKRMSNLIKTFDAQIKSIEKDMLTIIHSDEELNRNYELVISVRSIGLVNAILFLITTCNFTRFQSARQYGAYVAVVPYHDESGKSIMGPDEVSALGSRTVKAKLSQAAQVAIMHDPEMRRYYDRKVAEGKPWQKVMNAIKFKLILRVFAVINRQTPYVNTMKFASKT